MRGTTTPILGRGAAPPFHPQQWRVTGIEPAPHHRGEFSLPNRNRVAPPPPYPNPTRIGYRQGIRALNHDQGVCRPWTLHDGFAHRDDRKGVPALLNQAASSAAMETALSLEPIASVGEASSPPTPPSSRKRSCSLHTHDDFIETDAGTST